MKDLPPGPGEYDAVSVAKISPLVLNFKKLTERVLIAACMSPVPSSPAYPLKKDGKSIALCDPCSLSNLNGPRDEN